MKVNIIDTDVGIEISHILSARMDNIFEIKTRKAIVEDGFDRQWASCILKNLDDEFNDKLYMDLEEEAKQTPPQGMSNKCHNNILSLNKRKR